MCLLPLHERCTVFQDLLVLSALLHKAVPVLLDGGQVLLDLPSAGFGKMKQELLSLLTDLSETYLTLLHTIHGTLTNTQFCLFFHLTSLRQEHVPNSTFILIKDNDSVLPSVSVVFVPQFECLQICQSILSLSPSALKANDETPEPDLRRQEKKRELITTLRDNSKLHISN